MYGPLSMTLSTDVSRVYAAYPRTLKTANPAKIPAKKLTHATRNVSLQNT